MATYHTPLEPEDVLDLPLPDGVSGYELVDGRPEPVTPASWQHGELIAMLCARLHDYLKEHDHPGHIVSDAVFAITSRPASAWCGRSSLAHARRRSIGTMDQAPSCPSTTRSKAKTSCPVSRFPSLSCSDRLHVDNNRVI